MTATTASRVYLKDIPDGTSQNCIDSTRGRVWEGKWKWSSNELGKYLCEKTQDKVEGRFNCHSHFPLSHHLNTNKLLLRYNFYFICTKFIAILLKYVPALSWNTCNIFRLKFSMWKEGLLIYCYKWYVCVLLTFFNWDQEWTCSF